MLYIALYTFGFVDQCPKLKRKKKNIDVIRTSSRNKMCGICV